MIRNEIYAHGWLQHYNIYIFLSQIVANGCLYEEIKVGVLTSFSWDREWSLSEIYEGLMIAWACLNLPECVPILALLWKCLELSIQVNLQALKTKMADEEGGVTVQGWWSGSLRYEVGKVFGWLKLETHEPICGLLCLCSNCKFLTGFWWEGVFEYFRPFASVF